MRGDLAQHENLLDREWNPVMHEENFNKLAENLLVRDDARIA